MWPLELSIAAFVAAAAVIALGGTRLSARADRLADQTGLGEAVVGAVLLGGATSLPGSVTAVTAAVDGNAEFVIGNVLGGITVQTAFLGAADVAYRRANLEHAAASIENVIFAVLLVTLLAIAFVAGTLVEVTVFGVHPASVAIVATYAFGIRLVRAAARRPMWGPSMTGETRIDEPDEPPASDRALVATVARFALLVAIVGGAGWVLARAGTSIAEATFLSHSAVGTLLTGVASSLPELVTTIAAVRRGALTLAVGGILGGNAWDVLMLPASDVAYRDGSLYHALTPPLEFLIGLAILMTAVLVLGLLHREPHGPWNIGFESVVVLALYLAAVPIVLLA